MNEWWWSAMLIADDHRFEGAEWRCADCRRRVVDMLADRHRCQSPLYGSFVFVGGPVDGEWQTVSDPAPMSWRIALPFPLPLALDAEVPNDTRGHAEVAYQLSRMPRKGLLRYEFRG